MPNRARQTGGLVADDIRTMSSRMRDQAKQVLARNLKRAMIKAGIRPAELARRCGLTRDNISTYTRASSLAPEENIRKMAYVMGTTPEALLPDRPDMPKRDANVPVVVITQTPDGKTRLQIDRDVSSATAQKIIALLQADNDNKTD